MCVLWEGIQLSHEVLFPKLSLIFLLRITIYLFNFFLLMSFIRKAVFTIFHLNLMKVFFIRPLSLLLNTFPCSVYVLAPPRTRPLMLWAMVQRGTSAFPLLCVLASCFPICFVIFPNHNILCVTKSFAFKSNRL